MLPIASLSRHCAKPLLGQTSGFFFASRSILCFCAADHWRYFCPPIPYFCGAKSCQGITWSTPSTLIIFGSIGTSHPPGVSNKAHPRSVWNWRPFRSRTTAPWLCLCKDREAIPKRVFFYWTFPVFHSHVFITRSDCCTHTVCFCIRLDLEIHREDHYQFSSFPWAISASDLSPPL